MLKKLILLPTGGGGFSSGVAIGLGGWWGNFPEERYGMVELLGHEATHSWVLPFCRTYVERRHCHLCGHPTRP